MTTKKRMHCAASSINPTVKMPTYSFSWIIDQLFLLKNRIELPERIDPEFVYLLTKINTLLC